MNRAQHHNFAVLASSRCRPKDIEPWRHPVPVVTDEGRLLSIPKPVTAMIRVDTIYSADTLKIGGKCFKTYSTVSVLGAPIQWLGTKYTSVSNTNFPLYRLSRDVRFPAGSALGVMTIKAEKPTLENFLCRLFDALRTLSSRRPERLGFRGS